MSGRLLAWLSVVGVLIALGYAAYASDAKPDDDVLYQYDSAIYGVVQYGIMLALMLAIARGRWDLFALRRPSSWQRVVGFTVVTLVITYAVAGAVEGFADPGEEQGLLPDGWDSSRALPFALNFVVIALVAPTVEELTFRGIGYSLLAPYGRVLAILAVGLLFGLVHGLLVALPILAVFGACLAWLRERTDSVYPPIVVHAFFNAAAMILAVTTT